MIAAVVSGVREVPIAWLFVLRIPCVLEAMPTTQHRYCHKYDWVLNEFVQKSGTYSDAPTGSLGDHDEISPYSA